MALCAVTACNHNAKDELAHHHHEHNHAGHEGHDHGDGEEIILEPGQARQMGVEVETVSPGVFNNSLKVSGKITENAEGAAVASAPKGGTVTFAPGIAVGKTVAKGALIATVRSTSISGGDPNAAALAAMNAAKREVERLRPLHEHGIVSTADFNAAVAAYEAARAQYSPGASSGRVTAPVSGTVTGLLVQQGAYAEAGAPVASISSSKELTLRADVPQRYYARLAEITGATVRTPYADEAIDLSTLGARRVTGASTATGQGGYVPVYFTFHNDGTFMPGTPVEVFLRSAPRDNVISVPLTAISEQQGNYFVYIRLDEEGYLKSPVRLGESDGSRVEILSGLHKGDVVVTKGTTSVRLAETSNVVPEGHSHNH